MDVTLCSHVFGRLLKIFLTFSNSVNNFPRECKAVVTLVNLVNIFEIVSFGSIRNNSYSVSKVFMRVSFTSLVPSYVRHKRSILVEKGYEVPTHVVNGKYVEKAYQD